MKEFCKSSYNTTLSLYHWKILKTLKKQQTQSLKIGTKQNTLLQCGSLILCVCVTFSSKLCDSPCREAEWVMTANTVSQHLLKPLGSQTHLATYWCWKYYMDCLPNLTLQLGDLGQVISPLVWFLSSMRLLKGTHRTGLFIPWQLARTPLCSAPAEHSLRRDKNLGQPPLTTSLSLMQQDALLC